MKATFALFLLATLFVFMGFADANRTEEGQTKVLSGANGLFGHWLHGQYSDQFRPSCPPCRECKCNCLVARADGSGGF
ncbi:unnamed protein product [Schistocephalus solidus]|uniref:Uncharacterized protein n=1 Tax=Schistocephalus solidus TaxID=70667 RepID=A0A183TS61_SCHSO|nr:unnamed protein product [Schistocephalus solidus]